MRSAQRSQPYAEARSIPCERSNDAYSRSMRSIARAKAFKDSLAAKGTVVSGEFSSGPVTLIRGSETISAQLIETAPFEEGNNVEATLAAHLYKGAMGAGKQVWLILDGASGAKSGDLVGA